MGGFVDNSNVGATWVFARSGTTWVQQGPLLVGSGAVGPSRQGRFVALSADGNTLAVGGENDNNGSGATWVFTRSGTAWTQQGPKLVGTGAVIPYGPYQGRSVAWSADGMSLYSGFTDNSVRVWNINQ